MSFETTATTAASLPENLSLAQVERIAKLREQIIKIEARIAAVIAGKPAAAKKEVALPAVGDTITFTYGRATPTTSPKEVTGTVLAVKPAEQVDGKTKPALVRVQFGEGFDLQVATIFPAAIKAAE